MRRELTVRQTQEVATEILHVIANICEELSLRYCLFYGTLIGAVRHNGNIPWDDDIDVVMPREDHAKLVAYLIENGGKHPHLHVFNHDTCKDYPYMITRVSDDRYEIVMENEKPYGMGIFVDIYPFDGLGNTLDEALKFGLKGDRLSSLCYQATRKHCAVETTTSPVRKIIKMPAFLLAKLCGKDCFQNRLAKLAGVKEFEHSKYVGCVVWLSGGMRDIFPREWLEETTMHPFEQYSFRIPKQYDKILTQIYGDYMKLPPEEERIGHHDYKVYEK